MRSKATNALQSVVLLTGVIYIIVGLSFFISPYRVLKLFSSSVTEKAPATLTIPAGDTVNQWEVAELTEEDWLKQIINDDIISPLYFLSRVFAAFLMISGISMVMPLFDPLRYRGLIYYNGLIFPFISALSLSIFIRSQKSINVQIAAISGKGAPAWYEAHLVMIVLALLFTSLFLLTATGLFVTKKQTREGRE
ncbi:MAG: hypothetical protein E4G96_03625 [Chrysiogenales bacterium]|nr:MAG: hypothetical protein E4G96_03625 [Chrysiogenales bacterium]